MTNDRTVTPEPDEASGLIATALSASLTVRDLDASARWYRDQVGFNVQRQFQREGRRFAVSLRAGEAAILLTQDDGAHGMNRAKGEGFSLQITADATVDIDGLAERLRAAGSTLDT